MLSPNMITDDILFSDCKSKELVFLKTKFISSHFKSKHAIIYIFVSDLVWQIKLMIILGSKFVLCVLEIFNPKCLLIEFVIPNLSWIYFCIPESFQTNI